MRVNRNQLRISVLIIFHNESRSLHKTIVSVRTQKYPHDYIEIIAVDDGSTDNSVQIVKPLKVNKLIHTDHVGISKARNIGLKYCTGDVVLFIDAHVYLKRNVLYLINKILREHPEYAGVCGKYYAIEQDDRNYIRDIRRQVIFKKNNKALTISLNHFTTFSIAVGAYDRKLFNSFSFPLNFENSYGEDVYLQILAHNNGYNFLYDPSIQGIHDAEINYGRLCNKMIIEIRSLGNILFCSSLEKKDIQIPYLHYFLSYPLIFFITLALFILHLRLFALPLFLFFLLEIADALKCFYVENNSFSNKLETFIYLILKEFINGLYTPFYLIFQKRINIRQFFYISKQILKWEMCKIKNIFLHY